MRCVRDAGRRFSGWSSSKLLRVRFLRDKGRESSGRSQGPLICRLCRVVGKFARFGVGIVVVSIFSRLRGSEERSIVGLTPDRCRSVNDGGSGQFRLLAWLMWANTVREAGSLLMGVFVDMVKV